MLKLIIPKHLLEWLLENKGSLSLPVYIINCIAYVKDNNINIQKEREIHQERGDYDRTKGTYRKGKN